MNNPFEVIDERLSNIENLLLDIKYKSIQQHTIRDEAFLSVIASFLREMPSLNFSRTELKNISRRLGIPTSELLLIINEIKQQKEAVK